MPSKGRKHCRSLPPDFLRNLHHNVIDVILMRLPCKDAVRISILSKQWRNDIQQLLLRLPCGKLFTTEVDNEDDYGSIMFLRRDI
ncbi:hypothetical protein HAX54_016593 [Datura stramonium]|uniref:F-box domain-containing protein n=1 Tax=Datura stramonium TaxID=4076 RepID=A0ABS8UL10_DATST|nr:hypothetical protein [Datura stramonium]